MIAEREFHSRHQLETGPTGRDNVVTGYGRSSSELSLRRSSLVVGYCEMSVYRKSHNATILWKPIIVKTANITFATNIFLVNFWLKTAITNLAKNAIKFMKFCGFLVKKPRDFSATLFTYRRSHRPGWRTWQYGEHLYQILKKTLRKFLVEESYHHLG